MKKPIKCSRSLPSSKDIKRALAIESDILFVKGENLLVLKTSLKQLLNEIKTCEVSILSISNKSKKNFYVKKILIELSKELTNKLNDKKTLNKILTKENNEKKKKIQNKLFDKNEQFINNNTINKKLNVQNLKSEIFLLKTFNFMAENYSKQIESIITRKIYEIDYLKLCMQYTPIDDKEILCAEPKYYPFVSKLLHKELNNARKKLKLIVKAKQSQNEELEKTSENLNELKNFIERKKKGYIENKEIIQEESKEFTQSITLNKMHSNLKLNNILSKINQNKITETENEYGDNIIIIDNEDEEEDSFVSGKLTGSSNQEKSKKMNITNHIHQLINLNMNINFKLNINGNDNENIICNSERKSQDIINLLNKNKKKKGLASTGSLPSLPFNSIKEDSIEMSINESLKNVKKKVDDSNNDIYKLQNSKEIIKINDN